MLVVRKITDLIPQRVININVEVPDLTMLEDYRFNFPDKIDMLLGAEIFYELLRPRKTYFQSSKLLLQNTVFGYETSGCVEEGNKVKVHCGLIREEDLNKPLKKFWECGTSDRYGSVVVTLRGITQNINYVNTKFIYYSK